MTAPAPHPATTSDSFEPYGLGWRAVVCGRSVRITVRRLRKEHGMLRGYLDVEVRPTGATGATGLTERLAGEVVSLSSGRERAGFANRLTERRADLPWRNIVDAFCVEVERREEASEPAVWIGNLPPAIDGGWLVEGLLERNQNNGVHGDGSVGKSFVALAAAVSVTTGVEVLPGFPPLQRGTVLYLDWETDADTLNARVQKIARGVGIAPPDVLYQRMDGPLADEVERIGALVQQHGVVLAIVDSVEAAMAGSAGPGASPNEGPSKLNRSVRRLGPLTTFLIDHISAEQAASGKVAYRPYGNVFKRNWMRNGFQLKQAREPTADGRRHLGLFCTKRNNGREFAPVGLSWAIDDEICRWQREEIADPELEEALPTADRIAAYLRREGPSQPSAISEAIGIPSGTVRPTLARRSDLFEKTASGLWHVRPLAHEDDDDDPSPLPF